MVGEGQIDKEILCENSTETFTFALSLGGPSQSQIHKYLEVQVKTGSFPLKIVFMSCNDGKFIPN